MIQVNLFISESDPKLEEITSRLAQFQAEYPHQLNIIDIDRNEILVSEFAHKAPVLDIGVFRLVRTYELDEIRSAFQKSESRLEEAKAKGNEVLAQRISQPLQMTKSDRVSHWFSNHYMILANGFVFLYIFFALLAPGLMKIGWEAPAKVIYRVYSPLCHQLAYRSFFLFGEQPFYPRELASVEGFVTFGQASGINEDDINAARHFLGNETMGYKTALCQRDMAIYGLILVFGLVFSISGRKIKPLPWFLWVLLGLAPIGLDGFSQLLSQTGWGIFSWIPLRESTPLFRVVTGALFGLTSAWFGYPYLEEAISENRYDMQLKFAIVEQIEKKKDRES